MPLPGGGADKAGNRYELRWTVRQFIRLLIGEASWIHLEPIGAEGELVEFRLGRQDSRIEAHQVKRQQAGKGHWTIADLDRNGVLKGVRRHAVEGDADFVFVSTQAPKSLPELSDRAQVAPDFAAFQAHLSIDLKGDCDRLQGRLAVADDEQAWQAVRRSRWIAQDERGLSDMVVALLDAHLTGDPQAALGVLALFALDAAHRRVLPQELWDVLAENDIHPSDVARDQNLVARLQQCREDYLQSQDFAIGGLVLPRAEVDRALECLLDTSGSTKSIFLVGPAGVGKTGVTGQIVERMAAAGWLVLPFRLDRLDPTQRPAELGRQLLGREKSPVAVLKGLAADGPCLLVIEQLDAVSVVSGRRPEMFDLVATIVREARAHSNMRLLLVCRAFDLENDQRLRDLRQKENAGAKTIPVGALDTECVKEVVARLGVSPERLETRQIELLRLPLHLALLDGVIREDPSRLADFVSAKDLYDAFWRSKRTALLPVLNDANSFETLLYALCDAMNNRQALSVPRGLLPPGDADLDRLISAHVLIRHRSRLSFFHEGFFDYVFARRFCETGEPLLELLRSTEQDLFRRSQVRQILAFRRDDNFEAYLDDLRSCLAATDVRFHMKKLMIGAVGQVADPQPEEWTILEAQLPERTEKPPGPVRDALWSSAPWFRLLQEMEVLPGWLTDDRPEIRNFAFNWVGRMVAVDSDRVADALDGLAGLSEEQDERILAVVIRHGAAADSERIEILFDRLATGPGRDWSFIRKAYRGLFGSYCYGPGKRVRVACRALGRWLRLLADAPDGAVLFAYDHETQGVMDDHQLVELAKNASEALVEATTTPFMDLVERAVIRVANPPFEDRIWHDGFRGLTHWAPENLLISLVDALKQVAASSPDLFGSACDRLRTSQCRTTHGVLLRCLAVEGGAWKSYAVDYLVETWSRWGIWYGREACQDCRCLVQTLAPYLDENDIARLEPWILNHFERWRPSNADELGERSDSIQTRACWFRWRHGQEQFELLSALPPDKLSTTARRRFGELSRKARSLEWQQERPRGNGGRGVVSPLAERVTNKMTDAQWLSAIRKYCDDAERVWLEDRVLGGARELARVLEKHTKAQPERFARLMLALPDDANEHYFQAILMGVQGGALPLDLVSQVVERAHNRPARPYGRWIPSVIASHGDSVLSESLLDVVSWYAIEDPDPSEELWRKDARPGFGFDYGGDPYEHGINSVRGSAARAVADLIARDERHWAHFAPVLERMVGDPSIAVRTCAAEACTQALRYDRTRAIALFLRLCQVNGDLLASPPIERFLYFTAGAELEQVRPIIERMLASPISNARQGAARQATLVALSEKAARSLADKAMYGDAGMRKGAAEVLSHNILTAPDRAYCEALLVHLFDDSNKEVRQTAGSWIGEIREQRRLEPVMPVAEALVASPAFAETAGAFFRAIDRAVDAPPSLMLRAGHRFLELAGAAAGDPRRSSESTAQILSKLVLRAYRQAANDPDLRRECLDLFDRLLEVGGYGADEAIEAFGR